MKPSEFRPRLQIEHPIMLYPVLAQKLWLNKAIVFQQLHYWLTLNEKNNINLYDWRYWCFNTIKEWKENNFTWWSEKTIAKAFSELRAEGIIIYWNYNKKKFDKTKRYTIDYKKVENFLSHSDGAQEGGSLPPFRVLETSLLGITIPETTTEITTDIDSSISIKKEKLNISEIFEQFWKIYPRKISKWAARKKIEIVLRKWIEPQLLIDWANKYALACKDKEQQYIKHPTTWLNRECRDDELDIVQSTDPVEEDCEDCSYEERMAYYRPIINALPEDYWDWRNDLQYIYERTWFPPQEKYWLEVYLVAERAIHEGMYVVKADMQEIDNQKTLVKHKYPDWHQIIGKALSLEKYIITNKGTTKEVKDFRNTLCTFLKPFETPNVSRT